MARYTYDFRYDAQGVIDYGHYRSKARKARNETRTRLFRKMLKVLMQSIGLMLRSATDLGFIRDRLSKSASRQ